MHPVGRGAQDLPKRVPVPFFQSLVKGLQLSGGDDPVVRVRSGQVVAQLGGGPYGAAHAGQVPAPDLGGPGALQLGLHLLPNGAALLPGGEEARHIPGVQGQGTHGKRAAGRDASAVIGHKLRRAAADVGQQAGRSAASRGGALEGKRGLVRAGEDLHGQAGHLPYGLHSVLGVDNVAQRGGAEDVQVMEAEVIQQGAEPGQRPAGHQDAAVGERAVLDIACQPGHHFFVQQQLELRPLPAVDGQPDGVGAYVRNAAFHGKHLALFGLVCIRLSLRAFRADINGIYESFTWDPCPYPPRRRPPGSRLPVPRAGRRSAPDCPPAR